MTNVSGFNLPFISFLFNIQGAVTMFRHRPCYYFVVEILRLAPLAQDDRGGEEVFRFGKSSVFNLTLFEILRLQRLSPFSLRMTCGRAFAFSHVTVFLEVASATGVPSFGLSSRRVPLVIFVIIHRKPTPSFSYSLDKQVP